MGSNASSSRRGFLAGASGTLAATSGCLGNIRNLAGRQRTGQLSLDILTMPAADDPYAVRIATRLADNLTRSGIDASIDLMGPDVLHRETLINHDFDIYVSRYPSQGDPDELRSMLYSAYGEEAGWQNPFGFSDITTDELLDDQRLLEGDARVEITHEIQRRVVQEQPFTVVGFPDRIAGIRTDRFERWPAGGLGNLLDYLNLNRVGETRTIRLLLRNDRITRNRNPIAVEHVNKGNLTGLLYEPIVQTREGRDPIPWLARTIEWDDGGWRLAATIQLRETKWHDGEPLTAQDVAFTYEFLKDTSLGEFETPVPTPWRRGRLSLVDSVNVYSDTLFQVEFSTPNRELANRALNITILPEHIWRDRSEAADLIGIDLIGQTTDALVNSNEETVGSGPVQFEESVRDQSLSLVSFPDHFIHTGDTKGIPGRFSIDVPFERIEFTVTPSHDAAVELLVENEADASADGLQASVVPRIIRTDDVSLTIRPSESFYHIGYNCRESPMTDPNFRRVVARHVDREFTIKESLRGYGTPSEVPLGGEWSPGELVWDGDASLSFFGEDGELDVEAAREAFREAGYQYENEQLVRRGG